MPAHPQAFQRLTERLRATQDPALRDQLLDQWVDYRDRATEWDADQWGLEAAGCPFTIDEEPAP